ncbi:ABC transporter permease [Qiania dongpingensis]|uniref:ABC transporter permease n=1 Tax=Qiania dongpingensis TaxID=2763669 RepID=A0A7G9G4M0_9FIRM|nr:ABC transporter permease [Qiania dongpingensis]QNM05752.1 ABC transporter permease [Qiania dongpingensis]
MKKMHVLKFTGKYLVRVVTLLIAVSIISFILVSASPVDPVQQYVGAVPNVSEEQREKIAEYWGLNDPPLERFLAWGNSILHGDFGTSLIYRRPVLDIIKEKFAASLALMLTAWLFSGLIGFGIGCAMGIFNGKWLDKILKKICLIMCSIPTFWIGIVFLMFFSVKLGWFPMGMSVPKGVPADEVTILQRIHHLVLPALTLSFLSFANVALHTREKLVDVLESDYVLFAKARGESRFSILKRHGFRNILLPAVTMQFGSFSELFGGSVLAESVFSYPGLGAAAAAAGMGSDIPLLLGITLFSALFVFAGNMLANIIYGIVDPQIKEGYKNESYGS